MSEIPISVIWAERPFYLFLYYRATWKFSDCCFLSPAFLMRSFFVRHISVTNNAARNISAEAGRLFTQVEKKIGDAVSSPHPPEDVLHQSVCLLLLDSQTLV